MNPLGAIRQFLTPEMQMLNAARTNPALPGGSTIPAQELQALTPGAALQLSSRTQAADGSFGNVLGQMVQEVNAKSATASDTVRAMLSGQNVSLHQAVLAMEEASVSFQLMVEVRNKLLESYQELMRMQV